MFIHIIKSLLKVIFYFINFKKYINQLNSIQLIINNNNQLKKYPVSPVQSAHFKSENFNDIVTKAALEAL